MNIHTAHVSNKIGAMYTRSAALDPTALAALASDVGPENVSVLLVAFVQDLVRLRQKASIAVSAGDTVSFAGTMHSLRGVCSYFGAIGLGAIATRFNPSVALGALELEGAWAELEPMLAATAAAASVIDC